MKNKNLPTIKAFEADIDFDVPVNAVDKWSMGVSAKSQDERTLNITDEIGDRGDGRGITVNFVRGALRRMGAGDITVNINSPGGDFFTGLAVYNLFREHDGAIKTNVIGIAASAASLIAMASDELRVAKAGFLMIHNAQAIALGNRHDMRTTADLLEQFDSSMAGVYSDRSGIAEAKIAKFMDSETFFKGQDAVDAGLADGLLPSDEIETVDEDGPEAAFRRLDVAAAKGGMPRTQRRQLIKEIKSGTLGASASDGMPSAANKTTSSAGDTELLAELRALTNTIK